MEAGFSGYQDFKAVLVPELLQPGETPEVVYAINKRRENDVFTAGMTDLASSSLARAADLLLLTAVPETILYQDAGYCKE